MDSAEPFDAVLFGQLMRALYDAGEVVADQFKYERGTTDGSRLTLMMGLKLIQLTQTMDALEKAGFVPQECEPERHTYEEWQAIRAARETANHTSP